MAELSYKDQQDLKNIEKIREHLQILPRFCGEYFRSLEIRKSTNTRKNYAYDLGVFFYFLVYGQDISQFSYDEINYKCAEHDHSHGC